MLFSIVRLIESSSILIPNTTNEFLENNKELIIEETSKKLAEKLSKTKKVKDMLENVINKTIL